MRRLCLALLTWLAVAPAHAAPPGYAQAQAAFEGGFDVPTRLILQTWLIAGGFDNAVPVDHFSTRTFKAIQEFQTQNGFTPTGRIDKGQVEQLFGVIRRTLATWGLRKVSLPGRAAYTWVPLGLGLDVKSNASGLHFSDPRKRLWLDFVSAPDRTIESVWDEMLAQEARQEANVHFKIIKDGWFVISATTPDNNDHYYRYYQDGTAVTGFALEWNNEAENIHAERIAALASGALKAAMDGTPYIDPPFVAQAEASAEPAPEQQPAALPKDPAPEPPRRDGVTTGTAFFVSDDGYLVTNAHVVAECTQVMVKTDDGAVMEAARTATDTTNDLAILKLDFAPGKAPKRVAALRLGARLGEGVEAFGFPHTDLLSSSGNFTLGNVSALTGLKDDSRYLQVSVPVQAGNSGGPLLDGSGNLVGVVSAKLDAMKMASASGDLPQNVNFAVKSAVVATFLDANRVTYRTGSPGGAAMQPADIADAARAMRRVRGVSVRERGSRASWFETRLRRSSP